MSEFQIFINYNSKNHVLYVDYNTSINKLSRDICLKFGFPYKIEYDMIDENKIVKIETPFYIICNSKVFDRCHFKTINGFNTHWPKNELTKDCTLGIYLIHTSKLWPNNKKNSIRTPIVNFRLNDLYNSSTSEGSSYMSEGISYNKSDNDKKSNCSFINLH